MVEMVITLVICAIVILTAGAIASVSNRSYEKIRNEAQIYDDVFYGYNYMKYACRNAATISVSPHTITCDGVIFQTNATALIYTDTADHTIISNINNPTFLNCTTTGREYDITLQGGKNYILSGMSHTVPFDFYTNITKRNP